jgi:hypothetical protein
LSEICRVEGNTSLTEKGFIKSEREFLEFFINGKPLSELLDTFHALFFSNLILESMLTFEYFIIMFLIIISD